MNPKTFLKQRGIFLAITFISLIFIFAFQEPTEAPPGEAGRILKVQSGQLIIDKQARSFNSRIIIDGGKLGFNLTSPTALFHLKSTSSITIPFQIESLDFYYRRTITIDNTQNTSTLTDYQVLINFDTQILIAQGKMRSDCGDIRFTDSDGSTQLNYWLESGCNTPSTTIWVKIPSIPSSSLKTIYLYYGNSSATSQSNTSTVFISEISDLIGAWNFNEGAGTVAYDSSGNNNNGTLYNGPQWVDGKVGKALYFDGVNDYVSTLLNIDQSSSNSLGITMVSWVYPNSTSSGRHHVISSDNGGYDWSILREGGTWYVFTGESSRSTTFSVDLNQWQNVTAVFTPGTGVKFYKNSQEVTVPYIDYDTSDNNISIGKNPGYPEYFAGIIDEAYIFNRALSPQEVLFIYNNAGYSTPNYPGKLLIRKYVSPEPTYIFSNNEESVSQYYLSSLYLSTSSNLGLLTSNPLSTLSVNGNVSIGYAASAPDYGLIVLGKVGIGTATPLTSLEVANRNDVILAGGRYGVNVEGLTGDKTLNPRTDKIYQYLNPNNASRIIYLSTTTAQTGDRFVIKNTASSTSSYRLQINVGSLTIDYIYANSIREYVFDGNDWVGGNIWSKTVNEQNICLGIYSVCYSGGIAIGGNALAYPGVAIGGYAWAGWTNAVAVSGGYAIAYTYGVAVGGGGPRGYYYGVGIGGDSKGIGKSVAVGKSANFYIASADNRFNTAVGAYSGYRLTRGIGNIILGYQSGYDTTTSPTTGSYNILIGYQAGTPANDTSNFLNIGNLIFATGINTATGSNISNGKVGIRTLSPTALLHLKGQTGYDQLRLETPYTPTSTADPNGNIGDITWDDNYLYVKTSGGWKRATGTTF